MFRVRAVRGAAGGPEVRGARGRALLRALLRRAVRQEVRGVQPPHHRSGRHQVSRQ